jgi:hypothetical protein
MKREKQHRLWIWRRDGNNNNRSCGFEKEMEMATQICVDYAKAWNFI